MEIEINNPSFSQPAYRFGVEGTSKFLEHTYNLLNSNRNRNLLIFRDDYSLMQNVLTNDQINEFRQFRELVKEKARNVGHVIAFKETANEIHQGEDRGRLTIGVYTYGAVPIYLSDVKRKHVFYDNEIESTIGFYPNLKKGGMSNLTQESINPIYPVLDFSATSSIKTNPAFLKTLFIDLECYFTKYFEDVGRLLYEIRCFSDSSMTLKKLKDIEIIIAKSIKGKIDALNVAVNPNFENEILLNNDIIQTAIYGRKFILFLVNELYSLLGISAKDKYRDAIESLENEFSDDITLENELSVFVLLYRLFCKNSSLTHRDLEREGILLERLPNWLKDLANFTIFLANCKEDVDVNRILPITARLFISAQHDVKTPNALKSVLNKIHEDSSKEIVFLQVDKKDTDSFYKDRIVNRIWLSDKLLAIISKETKKINENTDKDFKWIAREMITSYIMSTDCISLVEKNADIEKLKNDIKAVNDPLIQDLRGYTITDLHDRVINDFIINKSFEDFDESIHNQESDIDPRIKSKLEIIVDKVIEFRCSKLIEGWLEQIDPKVANYISYLNYLTFTNSSKYFDDGMINGELIRTYFDRKTIKQAINVNERRQLRLRDRKSGNFSDFKFMEITKNNKIRGAFDQLIDNYFGGYNRQQKNDILKKAIEGRIDKNNVISARNKNYVLQNE